MEARVCAYCKGNILTPITNESYKCKKCGSINYDVDKEINIKLANAQTELSTYNFTRADDIYKNILDNTTNPKVEAMALKGRICAYFGIVYVKGFYDDEVVATFANYDEHKVSIKSTPYYRDLLECEISEQDKQAYIDELNELDEDYQKIKEELDKTPEYDVFICTKISTKTKEEPNARGFTDDYEIAQDFYDALEEKGLNVFLSKKSLKGVEYDGQIFSALMRSKLILIISTCKEYLESCWVESEWRRWLNFIDVGKRGRNTLCLYLDDKNISLPLILSSKKIQKFYSNQQIELLGKIYDFTKEEEVERERINIVSSYKADSKTKKYNEFDDLKLNNIAFSKGLDYKVNSDGKSYSVVGIGECCDQEIVIPMLYRNLNVTSICKSAFYGCKKIKSIEIPSSIVNIESDAFYGCDSLEKVYYNGMIEHWCKIKFNSSTANPMSYAKHLFLKAANNEYYEVTEVEIPRTVTKIGNYQFKGICSLTNIVIHDSVTSIGEDAFSRCSSLESIIIPNSVTRIGSYAFSNCYSLKNVELPDSITSIVGTAFYRCQNLKFSAYDNAKYLGNKRNSHLVLMEALDKNIKSCMIYPKSTKIIASHAFWGCRDLESIEIPRSVTHICSDAFWGCSNLRKVIIPNSVTCIEEHGFPDCFYGKIYCEAITKPSGWHSNWKETSLLDDFLGDTSVSWGYKM